MRIGIFRGLVEQIRRHASHAMPNECCGLLLGREGQILEAVPSPNMAADTASAFEIDPTILLATHRRARNEGFDLGCYHSHPGGDPTPSARDAEQAVDTMIWLIASPADIRAWRFDGAGAFEPVDLMILP